MRRRMREGGSKLPRYALAGFNRRVDMCLIGLTFTVGGMVPLSWRAAVSHSGVTSVSSWARDHSAARGARENAIRNTVFVLPSLYYFKNNSACRICLHAQAYAHRTLHTAHCTLHTRTSGNTRPMAETSCRRGVDTVHPAPFVCACNWTVQA